MECSVVSGTVIDTDTGIDFCCWYRRRKSIARVIASEDTCCSVLLRCLFVCMCVCVSLQRGQKNLVRACAYCLRPAAATATAAAAVGADIHFVCIAGRTLEDISKCTVTTPAKFHHFLKSNLFHSPTKYTHN